MSEAPPAGPPPAAGSRPGRPWADAPDRGRAAVAGPRGAAGAGPPRRSPLRAGLALTERLGFRLAWLLTVALLPLGVIALVQAEAWRHAAREQAAAALMGETLRAAAPTVGLIREARGAAAALAQAVPALMGDEAACDAAMTGLKAASPHYSVAAFVPASGLMTCGSDGAAFDYGSTSLFLQMREEGFPAKVYVQARGPVSGVSVVLVVHPVALPGEAGAAGYVGLAMPHAALGRAGASEPLPIEAPLFATFNGDGTVLTASTGLGQDEEILPRGVALASFVGDAAATFTGLAPSGEERLYAVVPVVEDEFYAVGSVPARRALVLGPVALATPFLFTALMWAGSLLVAWFAAERLVTRYIRRLSRAIRAFAQGSRLVGDLDMARAPAEIRDAGDAFVRMTDAILHDEAELEDTVHQKEVLLREVHHRVKNNLQLIASIMNMQMRRARSPETRALMEGLQERVMSLATVHKELYQTSGLADVRADELLGDITRQILHMASGPGRRFQVETDFAPLRLTPDQAVPLSLLLTEGLTNAIKYAAAQGAEGAPRLRLALQPTVPGRAALTIVNGVAGAPGEEPGRAPDGRAPGPARPAAEGTGLGGQLIAAFAGQLGGEARREVGGGRHALSVEFALVPLEGGEERRAAPGPHAA